MIPVTPRRCFSLLLAAASLTFCNSALAQNGAADSDSILRQLGDSETKLIQGRAETPPLLGTEGEIGALLSPYSSNKTAFNWKLERGRRNKTYEKYRLSFPSALSTKHPVNNTVHANYYRPLRGKGPHPAAVILHHLGGSFEAEEIMAAHLAQHGVAAATLVFPFYGPRRPPGVKRDAAMSNPMEFYTFIRQAVLDVRRAADVLRAQPDVNEERVGLLGVSLGAIVGSLSAGVDARFHRSVLILGGGGLSDVLLGDAKEVSEIREFLEKNKIDRAQLAAMLRSVDPVTFAHRVKPESVLMLNASNDEIIPKSSTLALHKAFGEPEIHWYRCGHYGAALHIFNVMRRSLKHLKK